MLMGTTNIAAADAGPTVADVMLPGPEVHPPSATVADVQAAFESPRQKLFLVADGARYVGAVERDFEAGTATTVAELDLTAVPTLAPDAPVADIYDLGRSRIPVVDADGALVGLVCFNRTRDTFCVA